MRFTLPLMTFVTLLSTPALAAESGFSGRVENPNGAPIANVFVQQQGGIASAISDERGNFTLKLDPHARQVLVYSAVGFLNSEVPVGPNATVKLQPVPSYRPTFVAVPQEVVTVATRLFDTEIGMMYGLRNQATTFRGRNVEGWANNELLGAARYRVGDVALGLWGFRNKVPMTMTGLANQPTLLPTVETSQWNLSVGYGVPYFGIEWLPQLVYSNYFVAPSNAGIPWSGTPLDYAQTRQGVGLALDAGTRFGPLDLLGHLGWSPYATTLNAAPYALDSVGWNELGLVVGYNVAPGLRTDLAVRRQFSAGNAFGEWANVYSLGLSYHPERNTP